MNEDYSQPDFYRFNSDSLELAKFILKTSMKPASILDLGAGSGIIGIELARILNPKLLTFVELQPEYLEHLQFNCQKFLSPSVHAEIVISSFGEFASSHKYDLIVCNPPYYLPGAGELPNDPRRALARSFLKDSWDVLLNLILKSLSAEGRAFLVLKKDEKLKLMLESNLKKFQVHELNNLMIFDLLALDVNGDEGRL